MGASTLREHLSKIRDGFQKIETITRQLGTEPRQEALEAALRVREEILSAEVDTRARELSPAYPDWHILAKSDSVLKGLIGESEDLMRSIMRMDEQYIFCRQSANGKHPDKTHVTLSYLPGGEFLHAPE